jgi:hypothetical protein
MVAFRSAKERTANAAFVEQKATIRQSQLNRFTASAGRAMITTKNPKQ